MHEVSTISAADTSDMLDGVPKGNLRAQLRQIRSDSRDVMEGIAGLWPLVWRATADRRLEEAWGDAFELGRWTEERDAERRAAAPAMGSMLRTVRETMGLSVAEVAARVDIDALTLKRIERGDEVAPDVLASRLARVLGAWMAEGRR
jgi:DNA-binding XRE family transcriptional regulator